MDPHTHVLLLRILPIHKLTDLSVVLSEILWAWELLSHLCLIGCHLACIKEEFAMELTKQDRDVQRWDPRQYVRAVVNFRTIATDKAGLASGQVIDITTRGCGLRLTKPLRRGQYLTLKVSPDNGTAAVEFDLVQVQWVEEERAGVAFMAMSLENERMLHQLCGDRLRREHEKVPGKI
jgi:hypothetical protein